jgi:hypothetical protein
MRVSNIYTFSLDKYFSNVLKEIETKLKSKTLKSEDELKN